MFEFGSPALEAIPRVAIIYFALLVLLRVAGKRQMGQLGPIDILTLLLLSETVSPALTAQDPSLVTAIVAAATLVVCDFLVAVTSFRSHRLEAVIEGTPSVLIRDGEIDLAVMRSERVSMQDIERSLRKSGVRRLDEVSLATIETDGEISVLRLGDA